MIDCRARWGLLLGLFLGSSIAGGWPAPAQGQPNLLIIQTDEHHYRTLGCYGGTIVDTPHIDRLAREGVLCTSFYATTPVCSPSRAALVSGRYPQNTPVVTNNIPLADEIVTFAEVLRLRGYTTGYAGKWHLDGAGKPQWAPERQFGFADNRFMFNRGHWKMLALTGSGPAVVARNNQGQPTYGVDGADERSFTTDFLTNCAIDFVRAHHDRPFCYMLSLPDPHGPNTVRPPYDTMFADIEVPIPRSLRKSEEQTPAWARADDISPQVLRRIMPAYYGMVKCIDDNVGRLLETLDELEVLDETLIVFTSDHGDLCGEHGRLNKGVPYEGSARIPFLVRYPAAIPAGTVVEEALSCVDFMPSVLSLMDVEASLEVEGRDVSAWLTGAETAGEDSIAFLRGTSGWLTAVTDRYKLVYSANEGPWLFDLQNDPEELDNHFADPELRPIVRRLTMALQQYGLASADPYLQLPRLRQHMEAALAD